jgi:hypothetical protein
MQPCFRPKDDMMNDNTFVFDHLLKGPRGGFLLSTHGESREIKGDQKDGTLPATHHEIDFYKVFPGGARGP